MPKLPGVNHLDAVRAFEKAGFRIVRHGKHVVMIEATQKKLREARSFLSKWEPEEPVAVRSPGRASE